MKVYFISGIGADHRFFIHTRLPPGYEPVWLDYIPHEKKETLPHYARRLAKKIDDSEPFGLIGLSLGGIMASEIAKIHLPVFTILIASVPVSSQLPGYFGGLRKLGIHRILPGGFFKITATLKHIFTSGNYSDKKLILKVIWEGDSSFIRWATDAVLHWNNEVIPPGLCHIHGTRDEVFPLRFTKPTHVIPKAGHLLTMYHADEVNHILSEVL